MEFPVTIMDAARELLASARQRAKALTAEADEATRIERIWDSLLQCLSRGWPLHILALLEREGQLIRKLRSDTHPAISALEEANRLAKEQADAVQRRYPAFLEEAFRAAAIPLDADSRHPRYSLERKFFQLDIDDQHRTAKLSNYEGKLAEFPADIGAVVEAVQREHKRLMGRPFQGRKFLKQLRAQYLAITKKEKQPDGTSVPIRQITRRLGKNLKGFRSDEFLVDLSRLVEQGPTEIDGWRLDLQQTKDTSQGMLLWGAAARGYIGFVVFRRS
jgi:hypothetical protein